MIDIRPVVPAEWEEIETITRDAFWDVYQPGCDEHYLVHIMHQRGACIQELDLVARVNGMIAGHAVCTQATLTTDGRVLTDVLCLGPLTVAPAWQRQGVGSALIRYMVDQAASSGWRAIFLTGNPVYYGRFGFKSTTTYDITLPDGKGFPALQVLPLRPGALDGCAGQYAEPAIYYDLSADLVAEYDRRYPPREKHVLPGQLHH